MTESLVCCLGGLGGWAPPGREKRGSRDPSPSASRAQKIAIGDFLIASLAFPIPEKICVGGAILAGRGVALARLAEQRVQWRVGEIERLFEAEPSTG